MNANRSAALLARVELPSKPLHIVGLGRFGGNLALIKYLAEKGHQLVLWESSRLETLKESWGKLSQYHDNIDVHWQTQHPKLPKDDLVFITPAMPFNHPSLEGIESRFLSTEIELSLSLAELHGVILHAVIGSVGKSTCAALLSQALETKVIGNIGSSFLQLLPNPDPEMVVELSSFQLHYLQPTSWLPHSYIVTPIDDHHSDWHGGLEAYQKAKLDWVRSWKQQNIPGINFKQLEVDPNLFHNDVPKLIGLHNHKNIHAVWQLLKQLGRQDGDNLNKLLSFKGLPHRLELCLEQEQLKCYNDSKATSPNATLSALDSFKRVELLILQGNLKELDYRALIQKAHECCDKVWLVGGMSELKSKFSHAEVYPNLETAFKQSPLPQKGNILFSPAAPSYGDYQNYEERGGHFKQLINEFASQGAD